MQFFKLIFFKVKESEVSGNKDKEDYYFSVVDVISALTDSNDPAHYWRTFKSRMLQEWYETVTNCDTFKLKVKESEVSGIKIKKIIISM